MTGTPEGRRVVVTGIGILSAVGAGRDETWKNLLAGMNGIDHTTHVETEDLPSRVSGEVPEFDLSTYIDRKGVRRMDRFTHLAVCAAGEALDQAKLDLAGEGDRLESRDVVAESAEDGAWLVSSGLGPEDRVVVRAALAREGSVIRPQLVAEEGGAATAELDP